LVWTNGFSPTFVWLRSVDNHLQGYAEARSGPSVLRRSPVLTVDSLFAKAERDLGNPDVIVTQFLLDPRYGFPKEYHSEMPSIPDDWIGIKVDSFAVVSQSRSTVGRRRN
jgi:hypothetical protein